MDLLDAFSCSHIKYTPLIPPWTAGPAIAPLVPNHSFTYPFLNSLQLSIYHLPSWLPYLDLLNACSMLGLARSSLTNLPLSLSTSNSLSFLLIHYLPIPSSAFSVMFFSCRLPYIHLSNHTLTSSISSPLIFQRLPQLDVPSTLSLHNLKLNFQNFSSIFPH